MVAPDSGLTQRALRPIVSETMLAIKASILPDRNAPLEDDPLIG
jgi:hypothetical protein